MWSSRVTTTRCARITLVLVCASLLTVGCACDGRHRDYEGVNEEANVVACLAEIRYVLLDTREQQEAQWLVYSAENGDIEFTRAGVNGFASIKVVTCSLHEGMIECHLEYTDGVRGSQPMHTDGCVIGTISCSRAIFTKVAIRMTRRHWNQESSEFQVVGEEEQVIEFFTFE